MPSLNMPVQRLKVAILPLNLPCSASVTHSGEILTTGKSHGKKPDIYVVWSDYMHMGITPLSNKIIINVWVNLP